jgi:hypothetical protein
LEGGQGVPCSSGAIGDVNGCGCGPRYQKRCHHDWIKAFLVSQREAPNTPWPRGWRGWNPKVETVSRPPQHG